MTRKRYSGDFKKQIIELYNSGKTVLDIDREYDLHASVTYGWIKRYNNSGSFKASENRTPEENRLIELEKENMDSIMNQFEQEWYNSKCPNTYNNGLSPNQVYFNLPLV